MIIQKEIVKDLLSTTDVTIIGLLLVACVFLGYTVKKLHKRCIELEDLRVADKEKSQDIIVELAEKTITAIHQVTELAKQNKQ